MWGGGLRDLRQRFPFRRIVLKVSDISWGHGVVVAIATVMTRSSDFM